MEYEQKTEGHPEGERCIELAAMDTLMFRHWEELTGIGICKGGSYIVGQSGVHPEQYSDDDLRLLTTEERRLLLERADRPPLIFPCTPAQLLQFVDGDLLGDFDLPDDFRAAVEKPAPEAAEPTEKAAIQADKYQENWPLCTKREIVDGFQLTGKNWSDYLSRPNKEAAKFKEALKEIGGRGVGKEARWSPIIFARLLVSTDTLNVGQVKSRFVKVENWKKWEPEMLSEIGEIGEIGEI
ncbi:MAG: hypothetical protein IPP03_14765 [Dechloromonas sp.]|jgi:hypothetical protein|nr:hypothetical protein [Candidatus Dechloromonas phosphoritropha]